MGLFSLFKRDWRVELDRAEASCFSSCGWLGQEFRESPVNPGSGRTDFLRQLFIDFGEELCVGLQARADPHCSFDSAPPVFTRYQRRTVIPDGRYESRDFTFQRIALVIVLIFHVDPGQAEQARFSGC